MRRLALLTGVVTIIALLAVGESASARPGPVRTHAIPGLPRAHATPKIGTITSGSQWTLYYKSWHGSDNFCETLTFSSHTFLGDNTSTGMWSGNVKLKFTGGVDFTAGETYKGKLQRRGTYAGDFVGSVTANGLAFGPFILVPGQFC